MSVVYSEYEQTENYVVYVTISGSASENSQKVSRSLPNIISSDKHLRDAHRKQTPKSLVYIPLTEVILLCRGLFTILRTTFRCIDTELYGEDNEVHHFQFTALSRINNLNFSGETKVIASLSLGTNVNSISFLKYVFV